jgi:SAM-dependent methyltransferase
MNPAEYARMHALEDWYWWFVARRAAAARFLRDFAPPPVAGHPLRILDAGCGTGGMLDLYRSWPDVEATGLDFAADALRFSRERGHARLVAGDLTALPFRSASFDVVTALDVIEHVPEDAAGVREIARVLRPGGILVASVPAYPFLWGRHDVALHHQRRYYSRPFRRLVEGAGLRTAKQTCLLTFLFPLAAPARLFARLCGTARSEPPGKRMQAGLPRVPPAVNRALITLQNAELSVARRVSLPYGLTILLVARKP